MGWHSRNVWLCEESEGGEVVRRVHSVDYGSLSTRLPAAEATEEEEEWRSMGRRRGNKKGGENMEQGQY